MRVVMVALEAGKVANENTPSYEMDGVVYTYHFYDGKIGKEITYAEMGRLGFSQVDLYNMAMTNISNMWPTVKKEDGKVTIRSNYYADKDLGASAILFPGILDRALKLLGVKEAFVTIDRDRVTVSDSFTRVMKRESDRAVKRVCNSVLCYSSREGLFEVA